VKRDLFDDDHDALRESFGRYLDAEVVPWYDEWERAGRIPREALGRLGQLGFLGLGIDERFGGPGVDDFRFNAVLNEEAARRGLAAFALAFTMQNDVALPYLLELCTEAQLERWMPGIVSGELVLGIAMSEPQAGSDLAGVRTRAERRNGEYELNGSKTFITNGLNADLVITVVRTGRSGNHSDISLVVVENDTPGYTRGRNLEKLGQHAQDTAELFFDRARVPASNLLGEEGQGFRYLTRSLVQERLSIARWSRTSPER
jgi:acyl-CoA dehydrogenase